MAGSNKRASKKGCLASDLPMATETLLQIDWMLKRSQFALFLKTPFIHDFPWKVSGFLKITPLGLSRKRGRCFSESLAAPTAHWVNHFAEVPPKRPYNPVYDSEAVLLQLCADFQCCNFAWIGSLDKTGVVQCAKTATCRLPNGFKKSGWDPRLGTRLLTLHCCNFPVKSPALCRSDLWRTISTSGLFLYSSWLPSVRHRFESVDINKVTWCKLDSTQFDFTSAPIFRDWLPCIKKSSKFLCSLDLPADEPGHMGQRESQV